jgi:hypothetical protein
MGTFFHGWRRKVSCVALLTACMLACAWVRSQDLKDVVSVCRDNETLHWLVSSNGELRWITIHGLGGDPYWSAHNHWRTYPNNSSVAVVNPSTLTPYWNYASIGFSLGQGWVEDPISDSRGWVIVPYWSITLTLTLLSAYLILWKPRKE